MNFNELISTNTRSDEYVNATKLCKAFGKRWTKYRELPQTQEFLKAVNSKTDNRSYEAKRGVGTWVHPLVAIHLAEWLSPEFSLFVKQTFKQFLEADVELTKNLVSRTESLEAIEEIAEKTEIQRQYLRSEFALNYEGEKVEEKHDAKWFIGRVKGYNNDVTGVQDGLRSEMRDNDKATLLFIQLAQAKKLERNRKSDNPYLKAGEAKNDCYGIAKQASELMSGQEAPKPRDWNKMSYSDKQELFPNELPW